MNCFKPISMMAIVLLAACDNNDESRAPDGVGTDSVAADIVFRGGPIITMDPRNSLADAVAVKDGLILAAGTESDIANYTGADTRVIDLAGDTLMPGFIDSHSHLIPTARNLALINLAAPPAGDVTSIADIQSKLTTAISEHAGFQGEWLVGVAYDHSMLAEGRHPTRFELDEISDEIPILLQHFSGHMLAVNSKGLELAGISAETEDPPGGKIWRVDGSEEPSGVVEETAMALVNAVFVASAANPSDEQAAEADRRQLRAGLDVYAAAGFTTVLDAWVDNLDEFELLRGLASEGAVNQDVILFPHISIATAEAVAALYSQGYSNHLRIGGGKINLDGGSPGRTAYLREPYYVQLPGENGYRGYPRYEDQRELNGIVRSFYESDVPLVIHALGDAAVDQAIVAVREAESATGRRQRTQLIHLQQIQEDQLDALEDLDVSLSFQVAHNFYFGDYHNDVIYGPERTARLNPVRSALDRGLSVSIHHDSPVHPVDQMTLIWAAVNRVTRSGKVIGPEQRITVEEALRASTIGAAYQFREEDRKGSLEPGKLADLIVLDRNPLEAEPMELNRIRVMETIKEGKTIFRRSAD